MDSITPENRSLKKTLAAFSTAGLLLLGVNIESPEFADEHINPVIKDIGVTVLKVIGEGSQAIK